MMLNTESRIASTKIRHSLKQDITSASSQVMSLCNDMQQRRTTILINSAAIFSSALLALVMNLFKHKHRWETTHTNKWQIPTRQICKCGLMRETQRPEPYVPLSFQWIYSNGVISETYSHGDGIKDDPSKYS